MSRGPTPMDYHEKMRLRAAAYHATRAYPGPVGELICRELLHWEEFGYRFGGDSSVAELVNHVLAQPRAEVAASSAVPTQEAAA